MSSNLIRSTLSLLYDTYFIHREVVYNS
jgi:hypothetical protein